MSKETGGAAFPQCSYNMTGGYDITGGISIRDYFAAKAMQAILSSPNAPKQICENELAKQSYQAADAILEARK